MAEFTEHQEETFLLPLEPGREASFRVMLGEFVLDPEVLDDLFFKHVGSTGVQQTTEVSVEYNPNDFVPDKELFDELELLTASKRQRLARSLGTVMSFAGRSLAMVGYTFARSPNPLFRMAPRYFESPDRDS